ncbi:MAG: hypothetical protein WDW36_008787 [Sanguina aurantia]
MSSAVADSSAVTADPGEVLVGTTSGTKRNLAASADERRAARGSREGSSKEHRHRHKKHKHKDRKSDNADPTDQMNLSAPAEKGTRRRDEVGGGRGSDVESGEIQDGSAALKGSAADDVTSPPAMQHHSSKEAQPPHIIDTTDPSGLHHTMNTVPSSEPLAAPSLDNPHTHHVSTTHRAVAAAAEGGSAGVPRMRLPVSTRQTPQAGAAGHQPRQQQQQRLQPGGAAASSRGHDHTARSSSSRGQEPGGHGHSDAADRAAVAEPTPHAQSPHQAPNSGERTVQDGGQQHVTHKPEHTSVCASGGLPRSKQPPTNAKLSSAADRSTRSESGRLPDTHPAKRSHPEPSSGGGQRPHSPARHDPISSSSQPAQPPGRSNPERDRSGRRAGTSDAHSRGEERSQREPDRFPGRDGERGRGRDADQPRAAGTGQRADAGREGGGVGASRERRGRSPDGGRGEARGRAAPRAKEQGRDAGRDGWDAPPAAAPGRAASRYEDREKERRREGDGVGRGGAGRDSESARGRDGTRGRERERERERGQGSDRGRDRERDGGGGTRDGRGGSKRKERSPEVGASVIAQLKKLAEGEDSGDEEAREIEARRQRLAAIRAKHAQAESIISPTASHMGQPPSHAPSAANLPPPAVTDSLPTPELRSLAATPNTRQDATGADAEAETTLDTAAAAAVAVPAAADGADSDLEGGEEEEDGAEGPVFDVCAAGAPGGSDRSKSKAVAAAGGAAAVAAEADEDDMFTDAGDAVPGEGGEGDMFGAGSDGGGGDDDRAETARAGRAPRSGAALVDAYDDPEGYYNFQVGEVMDGRYEVFEFKGKGVFSSVLRARDRSRAIAGSATPSPAEGGESAAEVCIKMIRSNETMTKAGLMEQAILRRLAAADPENKKHVIRMIRAFDYRQHMCLVFEPMDMNLRDLTKKYGRNVGLNVAAVGMYTAQLLVALRHLKKASVLHADVKPDNILVNARRTKVKLCDFGSAMLSGDVEVTPYLVSRFYRSPEVILGLKYDHAMDMWAVGTVVYELFTGKILFPGRSNNEMLRLMMDVKGPFTKKMLRRGQFAGKHFDDDVGMSFVQLDEDPVTRKPIRRIVSNPVAKTPIATLLARGGGAKGVDRVQLSLLADLLDKMLALEPEKRIDPDAALRHPFVRDFLPAKSSHSSGPKKGAGVGA